MLQWQLRLPSLQPSSAGQGGILAGIGSTSVLGQGSSLASGMPWSWQTTQVSADWGLVGQAESGARWKGLLASPTMDAIGLAATLSWEASLGNVPLIGSSLVTGLHYATDFTANAGAWLTSGLLQKLSGPWASWASWSSGNPGAGQFSGIPMPGGGTLTIYSQSSAYRWGGYAGQAAQIVLTVLMPQTGVLSLLNEATLATQLASSGISAGEQLASGDASGVGLLALQTGLLVMRASPLCQTVGKLGTAARVGTGLVLGGFGAYRAYLSARSRFESGDYIGGTLDVLQGVADVYAGTRACFRRGTPFRTLEGSKRVEELREGDLLLSRAEDKLDGEIEAKAVEAVFRRLARILILRVSGREIGTTSEHPFRVKDRGWLAAGELQPGDLLASEESGRWFAVESVEDTGRYEVVYNVRVADHHTYFVGDLDWVFSVWAHNSYTALKRAGLSKSQAKRANMLYKTKGAAAVEAYLRGQGFSGSRLSSLMEAAAQARVGRQRGPNNTSGHTATILAEAARLRAAGNTIEAGGGIMRERLFRTPGGFKSGRRPDILYRTPSGELLGVNVGLQRDGNPILREQRALQDLNGPGGLPTTFVPYN